MNLFKFLFFFLFLFSSSLLFSNLNDAKKAYSFQNYEKAIQLFEKIVLEEPFLGESYFYLGQIYELQKKFDKSIEMFKKALNLQLNEDKRVSAYIKVILYYQRFAVWKEVFDYSSRLLEIRPNLNYIKNIKDIAEQNIVKQPVLSFNSNVLNPIDSLNQLLIQDSDNPQVHWQLALRYFNKKDFNRSLSHILILLQKEPNNPNYLYKGGMIYLNLNQVFKAIEALNQVIKYTDGNNFKLLYYTYINLGNLYFQINNYKKSVQSYRSAYSKVKNSQSLLGITKVKYLIGDCANAIKFAKRARDYKKHLLELSVYETLCLVKKDDSKFKNLENLAQQILNQYYSTSKIPSKYYPIFYQLGLFYNKQKKYTLSQQYFSILPDIYHNTKGNFYYQAVNFYETNQWNKALDYFLKVRNPSFELYYYLIKIYSHFNQLSSVKFYIKKASEFDSNIWELIQKDSFFNQLMSTNINFQYYIINKGRELFELKPSNNTKSVNSVVIPQKKKEIKTTPATNVIPNLQTPLPEIHSLQKEQILQEPFGLED